MIQKTYLRISGKGPLEVKQKLPLLARSEALGFFSHLCWRLYALRWIQAAYSSSYCLLFMKEEKVEKNNTCLLSCPTRCFVREVSLFYLLWMRDFPGLQGPTMVASLQLSHCNKPENIIGLNNQTVYLICYPQCLTTGAMWNNKLGKSDNSKNYVKQQWNHVKQQI